jgi:hypothetical protein
VTDHTRLPYRRLLFVEEDAMAVAKTLKKARKPARDAEEAARRLTAAGLRVREPARKGDFRPLNVPGLDL